MVSSIDKELTALKCVKSLSIYVSTRKTLILPKIGRQKTEGDKSLHGHGPAPEHLLAKLG